jgi:ABC-type glycerol-3-phosphate transport system substrate-binding protein
LGVCGNISATAESAVALFNSRHTEYYLAITHYDSTEDLNLAIISGEGPDIICLSGLCAENYTKGHLYDLYSIMSADEKAEFVEAYRMEYEVDGALYTISPVFCYETLVGNSLIGETEVSSFVDLEQAALLQSSEGTVWYQMLPEAVLKELLSDTLTQFVDFSNNTCSFQTDEFYALLALCNYATGAADESRQPLYSITRYNLTNYRMPEFPAGVPLGLPKAGVLTTNPEDSFGISAYTSEPEAAWEFIQLLLTDDIQKGYASLTGYYPVCQEAYEIAVPADLREIVSSAKGHRISISPVLDIVLEEAQAYFSGDKTAAQVADYIQSRVEIYLSEQS